MFKTLSLALGAAMTASAATPTKSDFSLTIYSSAAPGSVTSQSLLHGAPIPGYAVVRDQRVIALTQGSGEVRFTDVPALIDPTTVSFASLTDPDGTRVVEQNYQFDLVGQDKLLQKYIGERISVDQVQGKDFQRLTGRLLGATDGLILQSDDGSVVSLRDYTNVSFPSLPGGLITKPTLVWLVNARKSGDHTARVSYQAQGMTWWTDYNVVLAEKAGECSMDLSAWVSIVNQAGASFPSAQLKLVAGEVNRAPAPAIYETRAMMKTTMADAAAPQGFSESQLFEYHLYTLGRRTDLPNNSTKQLELFPTASTVKCKKELVFTAGTDYLNFYGGAQTDQGFGAVTQGKVGAYLSFDNKENNGMGVPLPAGRVRVNQLSNDGSLEFIGEDTIKHTPRNENVRVKLGDAFDIVGERKQTNFVYNEKGRMIEESFEISVRNRKKTAATVIAREYMYRWSGWDITASSIRNEKRDARTVDFALDIPADGEAKFSYTVKYHW
jgi:hypothetical protein